MAKSFRDQMSALQMGKADLIEVAPEEAHRAAQDGRDMKSSKPIELMALVFPRDPSSSEEHTLREALAMEHRKRSPSATSCCKAQASPLQAFCPRG